MRWRRQSRTQASPFAWSIFSSSGSMQTHLKAIYPLCPQLAGLSRSLAGVRRLWPTQSGNTFSDDPSRQSSRLQRRRDAYSRRMRVGPPSLQSNKRRTTLGSAHFEHGLRIALVAPCIIFVVGRALIFLDVFEPRSQGVLLTGLAVAISAFVELVVAPVALYRLFAHRQLRTRRNLVAAGLGSSIAITVTLFFISLVSRMK